LALPFYNRKISSITKKLVIIIMSDSLLLKNPEHLLIRKLNAFTEKIQEDIEKKRINEADGQRLILKATLIVDLVTKT